MRRRPSGERGPPVAMIVRRLGEVGAAAGAPERRLGKGAGRGDQDAGAFRRGGCQQVSRGGGNDDGGAQEFRRAPRPGGAGDQQPIVWADVRVQQGVGERA